MSDAYRILVVGGTGFIGHHLLRAARDAGFECTSLSLNPPSAARSVTGVRYLRANLSHRPSLEDLFAKEDFEFVVNLGGYVDHKPILEGGIEVIETHFSGLNNLVDVLRRDRLLRFVQVGSSDEYGDAVSPQREEERERPISPYSLSKVACTHMVQMLHKTEQFPGVILRLYLVYGQGQSTQRFLPQIIAGCLENKNYPVSKGGQLRDFCHVSDVVKAILCSLHAPNVAGEVINVASGRPVTIKEVIERVQALVGSGEAQFGAIPYRKGESMALFGNCDKAKRLLGWNPEIGFEEGLTDTINWYKTEYEQ